MENLTNMCGFRTFQNPRSPGIQIEGPNSEILNKMVEEMTNSNFDLHTIDSYITNMETFLESIEDPMMDHIGKVVSPQTLTALRFFFRQVLKANFPNIQLEGV